MHNIEVAKFIIAAIAALSVHVAASQSQVLARKVATMTAPVPRIAGGVIADKDDFEFIAFVYGQVLGTGSSCTGSLIGPNVVLTAGHCVYTSSGSMYMTSQMNVAFTHTKPTTMSDFTGPAVKEIIVNPNFNRSTLSNDLALIILESDIPSDIATPVKIYTGAITTSTPLTAAGFGITNPSDSSSVSPNLMKVDLVAGTTNYCKSIWSSFDPSKLICTNGAAGKDTCSGDSGGPLATRINNGNDIVLAGITSFAPVTTNNPDGLCAQAGSTGYYVHISYYIDWIANQTNIDVKSISAANTTNSCSSGNANSSSSEISSNTKSNFDSDSDDGDSEVENNLDNVNNPSIISMHFSVPVSYYSLNSDSPSSTAAALLANKNTHAADALVLVAIGLAVLFCF